MTLRLTNTLTRKTEIFQSLLPKKVSIYCCGVTVYDHCHLGHARSYIAWDVLRRYLIWLGYEVTFVQNFTDIDDKILDRAAKENCSMSEISERNIKAFHEDMNVLGILPPDRMPRATKCLDGIRALIEELVTCGAAYSIDGDVYFSVTKHANYGKLSGRQLEQQQLNADGRVTDAEKEKKQSLFDFALWKGAKQGEPSFPSPWGEGRPGWHIECSAMVREELGETIDIHLGGADLIFPHHENEIAQSEVATGKDLARYWLHNGMVNVSGQKMSKSLGNFTTIKELLKQGISPMTLRLFVLQAHYRKPIDFTDEALKAAAKGWEGLNAALSLGVLHSTELGITKQSSLNEIAIHTTKEIHSLELSQLQKNFVEAMNDDLNTSGALAVLFELARPLRSLANRFKREGTKKINLSKTADLRSRWQLLVQLAHVLGLKSEKSQTFSQIGESFVMEEKIKAAIASRKKAKSTGDYTKADKIRDELKAIGVELIDKPGGKTDWIRI